MRIAAAVALVPLLATSRVGHADPDVEIGFAAGANMPSGEYGGVVQVGPTRWLAIEGGVGGNSGDYTYDGVQTSLTARGRLELSPSLRGFIGLGESMGRVRHATTDDVCFFATRGCKDIMDGFAVWTNFEVGVELDLEHAFARVYGGVRWVDDPSQVCVEPEDKYQSCRNAGYFGVAVGVRI
jgi:hypothetical protein